MMKYLVELRQQDRKIKECERSLVITNILIQSKKYKWKCSFRHYPFAEYKYSSIFSHKINFFFKLF